MIAKACPVVLHPDGVPLRHLAFEHPKAGMQIVKGRVERGEDPTRAAMRELFEEAGLETQAAMPLGQSNDIADGQVWHFALCRVSRPVRAEWYHLCPDDGGIRLRFFWVAPNGEHKQFDPVFRRALAWIRQAL